MPVRRSDYWPYDVSFDVGRVGITGLIAVGGETFQSRTFRNARRFVESCRMAQQALLWEIQHAHPADAGANRGFHTDLEPVTDEATDRTHGLAEELRELASLHERGALTDEEFALARSKLLSP